MNNRSSQPHAEITVLLVEDDLRERESFLDITREQNWNIQIFESNYDAIRWLKKNDTANVVIIKQLSAPLSGFQAYDYIRQELKQQVPVIILLEDNDMTDDKYKDIVYIAKPFTPSNIALLYSLANGYRGVAETKRKYSIGYLETISDGNEEFILDCLQVFKSSVSVKLDQLDEEVAQNNYIAIGEIAHNIKPSFEMLENEACKDICNELTYNAVEAEVPALVKKLKSEFSEILSQLEEDYKI